MFFFHFIWKVDVPLEKIERDIKIATSLKFIQKLADYYNINKDLFANGYFRPVIDLAVQYSNENKSHGVYYGNKLPAKYVSLFSLIIMFFESF